MAGIGKKFRQKLKRVHRDAQSYSGVNVAKKIITNPKEAAKNIEGAAKNLTLAPYDLIKGTVEGDFKGGVAKSMERGNVGSRFVIKTLHPDSSYANKIERAETLARSQDPMDRERGEKLLSRIDRVTQNTGAVVAGVFTGGAASAAISIAMAARQEYLARKKDRAEDRTEEQDRAEILALENELMMVKMGLKIDEQKNPEKREYSDLVDGSNPRPSASFFQRIIDFFRQLFGQRSELT